MSYVNTVDSKGDAAICKSILHKTLDAITDTYCELVGGYAFYKFLALHTAIFANARSIEQYAFAYCSALKTIEFPLSKSVGYFSFYECTKLEEADFPCVTSVGRYAFNGCTALKTLILRSGTLAKLSDVNALEDTPIESGKGYIYVPYALYDSYAADSKWSTYASQLLAYDCGENATWSLENGVLTVTGSGDMYRNSSYIYRTWGKRISEITSIVIEDGITGVADFEGCTNATSVSFPDSLTTIYGGAFKNCTALTRVITPIGVSVGNSVFSGCTNLGYVEFGGSTINAGAFQNCSSLTALVFRNTSQVIQLTEGALTGSAIDNGTGYIYVPSEWYGTYTSNSAWSKYANQFRKLEEWTVDGTVTGEIDVVNRHMVRFFNSDGTLLGYKVVATGGSASYDGTPVCPEDASWAFNGFSPEATNVTADVDCYAQYAEPISLENASWAKIAEIAESGKAATVFAVGDVKTFTRTLSDGTTENREAVIIGFNHDDLSDGSGKAGISFQVKTDYAATRKWNNSSKTVNGESGANYGGWAMSDMRNTYLAEMYNSLPSDLASAIKTVSKESDKGGNDHSVTTTHDKLWLLSVTEVVGEHPENYCSSNHVQYLPDQPHGRQYEYYAERVNENAFGDMVYNFDPNGTLKGFGVWLRTTSKGLKFYTFTALAHEFKVYIANSDSSKSSEAFGFCI